MLPTPNSWKPQTNIILIDYTLSPPTLRYTPSDQQELAFHFTRKATLPDYTQLNPFTSPIDHQTFEQGNPLLRPEIKNRAEINYLLHGKKIQLNGSLYFNSTERFITPVTLFSEDNTLTLSYANGSMENKDRLGYQSIRHSLLMDDDSTLPYPSSTLMPTGNIKE